MMKLQCPELKTGSLPLKAVGFTVNDFAPIQQPTNIESRTDDAMMQSSNKRRRYQRRGSKVPTMFMADFNASSRQVNAINLIEVQRRILQDKEFLLSLQSSETRETSRTQCMKRRRASLDLLPKAHLVNGGDDSRRILLTDGTSRSK
jgi:hypothetical protein